MIVALVNGGALLDYRTRDGVTAMHRAVQASNFEAVKTLLGKFDFGLSLQSVNYMKIFLAGLGMGHR